MHSLLKGWWPAHPAALGGHHNERARSESLLHSEAKLSRGAKFLHYQHPAATYESWWCFQEFHVSEACKARDLLCGGSSAPSLSFLYCLSSRRAWDKDCAGVALDDDKCLDVAASPRATRHTSPFIAFQAQAHQYFIACVQVKFRTQPRMLCAPCGIASPSLLVCLPCWRRRLGLEGNTRSDEGHV